MQKQYELTIGKLKRTLPIIPITDTAAIASFVLLGDAELTRYAAKELAKRINIPFDYLVTLESKGIPLGPGIELDYPSSTILCVAKKREGLYEKSNRHWHAFNYH